MVKPQLTLQKLYVLMVYVKLNKSNTYIESFEKKKTLNKKKLI